MRPLYNYGDKTTISPVFQITGSVFNKVEIEGISEKLAKLSAEFVMILMLNNLNVVSFIGTTKFLLIQMLLCFIKS